MPTKKAPANEPLRLAADKHPNLTYSAKKTKTQPPGEAQIIARFDCGIGNHLCVRGDSAQLKWDSGVKMENIASDLWRLILRDPFNTCQFKIVLNDLHFEIGDNHSLKSGEQKTVTPRF